VVPLRVELENKYVRTTAHVDCQLVQAALSPTAVVDTIFENIAKF
jgi:hypothetical protein